MHPTPLKTGEPASTAVTIPATDMLTQILQLLGAEPPQYRHIQQNDGSIITCSVFSKDKPYLPDINIEEVYGTASTTIYSSLQSAASKTLQHLDTLYQLRLNDYNYEAKEHLIDENRSLICAKATLMSTLVDIFNTLHRDSLVRLQTIIQSAYDTLAAASEFPISTEEFSNVMNNIMQSMDNIYDQLLNIHNDASQTIENHGAIKSITSKMYSYIV